MGSSGSSPPFPLGGRGALQGVDGVAGVAFFWGGVISDLVGGGVLDPTPYPPLCPSNAYVHVHYASVPSIVEPLILVVRFQFVLLCATVCHVCFPIPWF